MKIYNFDEYVKENYSVNEGLGSWISSFFKKSVDTLKGWAKKLVDAISNEEIPVIPEGPKKGTPVLMYFPQSVSPVVNQMSEIYGSSKLSEEEVTEARYGQSWQDVPGLKGNVDDVSPAELANEVKMYYRSKLRGSDPNPVFVYGAPGIGKTGVIGQVCDELGLDMINIDIQFMSPEDFMGVPTVYQEEEPEYKEVTDPSDPQKTYKTRVSPGKGFTRFNMPTYLPTDNGTKGNGGIIFLDEFNRPQTKSVMDALMNFVQSGRIGEYRLPSKWIIVAAGNRPGEADVAEPDPALGRRFNIVNLVTTVSDFKKFRDAAEKKAKEKGEDFKVAMIDELIYFLSSGPGGKPQEDLLHYLDPEVDPLTFPAPANWFKACEMVYDYMQDAGVTSWKDLPIETIEKCFRRKVGPNAAAKFLTYVKLLRDIDDSDLDKISIDPQSAPLLPSVSREKHLLYAVMDMALRRIPGYDPERLANLIEYFDRYKQNEMLAWLYNRVKREYPDFANLDDDSPAGDFKERAALLAKEAASKKMA